MSIYRSIHIEEDFEAWALYRDTESRWLFNKLEVALRQGLHAGPAGSVPERNGTYIYRPAYNLYGMGVGAEKFFYHYEEDQDAMINYQIVPPGSFWCEWLSGRHLSIDYRRTWMNMWDISAVWKGVQDSTSSLSRFDHWERLPKSEAPKAHELPLRIPAFADSKVYGVNVEMIGDSIIEVHLRLGNDPFDDLPVGSKIIPVWNDEEAPEGEWRGNLFDDMTKYVAGGHLEHVRRGFIIQRPEESPQTNQEI